MDIPIIGARPPRADHLRLGIFEKDHVTLFLCDAGGKVIATAAMPVEVCVQLVSDIMEHVENLEKLAAATVPGNPGGRIQ